MLYRYLLCAIFVVLTTGVPAQTSTAKTPPTISGDWRSTKFTGSAVGDSILLMSFTFRDDSTFTATVMMKDGTKDTKTGSYHLHNQTITMIAGGEKQSAKFEFIEEQLVIHDPEIDSQVWFRRVSEIQKRKEPNKTLEPTAMTQTPSATFSAPLAHL